jgi:mannose-6-phosphate isomerase-like protein (cupin superfamily)
LHITAIQDSARHYHKETTEVYYILEGAGKNDLNGRWYDLEPGTTIWIEPGTRHRVVSERGLKTIVFAIPALNPADEWFD